MLRRKNQEIVKCPGEANHRPTGRTVRKNAREGRDGPRWNWSMDKGKKGVSETTYTPSGMIKARLKGFNICLNMNQMSGAFEQVVRHCRKRKKIVESVLNQI